MLERHINAAKRFASPDRYFVQLKRTWRGARPRAGVLAPVSISGRRRHRPQEAPCTWDGGHSFVQPVYPWEFVQIGNCGSPIELDEGWLLLTHGVGPVRKYSIGAVLLDKQDPSRVLARSRDPLVRPEPTEREGYVPNVVYTCGALRHGDRIILPYAVSDTFSNFATIKISALLDALVA